MSTKTELKELLIHMLNTVGHREDMIAAMKEIVEEQPSTVKDFTEWMTAKGFNDDQEWGSVEVIESCREAWLEGLRLGGKYAALRRRMAEQEVDKLWDSFRDAPVIGYRYLVTEAIEKFHGIPKVDDNSPQWTVFTPKRAEKHNVYLQMRRDEYDEAIFINGNFGERQKCVEYAQHLANALNMIQFNGGPFARFMMNREET